MPFQKSAGEARRLIERGQQEQLDRGLPAERIKNQLPARTIPPASGTARGGVLLSDDDPEPSGTADPGESASASRGDHVHDAGGGVSDGDKGDVTVSGSGTIWTVDNLPESRITGLVTDLALLAPLASPAFTGTPTAPTAVDATSSMQLATTAFVHSLITALINASPATLDTIKELADAIGDDPNFATTVAASIATKLAKASNLSDLTNVATALTNLGVSANGQSLITAANYAAMRALAGAAPANATYILQTANSETSAEQALSALASGYMKVTTTTGAITSQAPPIPVVDGGNGVAAIPAFSVHKNGTSQTISTATWTKLSWSTEDYDTNANFASDKFTPTVAGTYLLLLSVFYNATTDLQTIYEAIYKNGTSVLEFSMPTSGAGSHQIVRPALISMNGSTDYVEAYTYQPTGVNQIVNGTPTVTRWTGIWIGP